MTSMIPYVPSSFNRVDAMLNLSQVLPKQKTVDLGCGDGRVVVAFARRGAQAYGFEIDSQRYQKSLNEIKDQGLEKNAFIRQVDFWTQDLGDFDIITVFGMTSIMERLEQKIKKEAHKPIKLISNYFTLPHLKPQASLDNVHLYLVGG